MNHCFIFQSTAALVGHLRLASQKGAAWSALPGPIDWDRSFWCMVLRIGGLCENRRRVVLSEVQSDPRFREHIPFESVHDHPACRHVIHPDVVGG
jgi:hypothetical protein